jgi:uncharacterized protein YbjT (DUF2867 family)
MSGKILVTGATGTVGKHVVRGLLAKGEQVVAATRHATPVAGAETRAFDITDPATLTGAFAGVDRAYLLVPGGHLGADILLAPVIDAAAMAGVKVVLQSVIGVDADDEIPYRKAEIRLETSGARHVILRPNWFSDNFRTYWGPGIRAAGVIAVPAGEGRTSFIDSRDIAASAVAALTTDRFDGRAFNLTGPEAHSYGEAAAILTEVLGRPVRYQPVDDAGFIGNLTGAGVPADYAGFLAAIFHPVREGWVAAVTGDVEELTGRKPIALERYARDDRAAILG